MRGIGLVGLLGLLTGAGCATVRAVGEGPAQARPAWHEVTTAHFRVVAELGTDDAREVALSLERLRRALLVMWGEQADPPGRIDAYLPADSESLGQAAGYVRRSRNGLVLAVGTSHRLLDERGQRVAAHELTHVLSGSMLQRQPRWLAEGLAEYLSTVTLSEDGRRASFGAPPESQLSAIKRNRTVRVLALEELWGWDSRPIAPDSAWTYYRSAWAWTYYLMNAHRAELGAFLERLARAQEPRKAFQEAFAGQPQEALEAGLQDFLQGWTHTRFELEVPRVGEEAQVRPLPADEAHVARASLALYAVGREWKEGRLAAGKELEAAFQARPDSPSAWRLTAEMAQTPVAREEAARKAVAGEPQHAGAWEVLGASLLQRAAAETNTEAQQALRVEAEEAFAKAVALDPKNLPALLSLADLTLDKGETMRAYALAGRAVQAAPAEPWTHQVYAETLVRVGRCKSAAAEAARALELLTESTSSNMREAMRRRTEAALSRCEARTTP